MNLIYEINKNIVYVNGKTRGAIYNLEDGNVYSINGEGCKIIEEYILSSKKNDCSYLSELKNKKLISDTFIPRRYDFPEIEKKINFVWIELTEACNLRCIHCYDGDEHKDDVEHRLTIEEWKDILEQLKDLNCKKIQFIGGEPTVYPHFFDILKYAVYIGHKVEIYSNLVLFTEELVSFIKKNNITVHFSIYGSNSRIHDSITNISGSFDKTIYWAKRLQQNNIKIIPAITIMNKNQDDYENIIRLLKSININTHLIAVDTPRTTDKRDVKALLPSSELKYISLRTKPNFYTTKTKFNKAYSVNTCLFGKFSIQPNGNVSPCEFSRDILYGNLKKLSLKDILNSENLKKFWFLDFSKIDGCNCCEYRFACKDCRMITIKEDLYAKNSRCMYDPKTGNWLLNKLTNTEGARRLRRAPH